MVPTRPVIRAAGRADRGRPESEHVRAGKERSRSDMSERVGDHRERRGDREVPRGRFRLPDRRDQRGRVEPQDPTRREAHPGTDRPGTRFGAEWIKGNSTSVEYVGFERPTYWASIARSRRLDAKGEGRISS